MKSKIALLLTTTIALAGLAPAELISVDINNSLRATVSTDLGSDHYIGDLKDVGQNLTDDQIGVWDNGAAATNVWNYANFSASSLRDADGSITGVSYTISNTTNAASDWTAGTPFDDLVVDGVFQVAGNPITTTVSGLGIGARYNVLVYHADNYVTETVTVNGQAASDHTGAVANPGYTDAFDGLADSDFWYFANVEVDGSGELVISSDSSSGFFTLTGFQLELIPESPDPPSAPTLVSPADVATGVSTFSALAWSAGAGATSYGVYLWETSGTALTPSDPPTATVSALTYDPGVLNPSTGYSWFIKAINANGETPSSTWTFTTDSGAPLAPTLSGPADAATNQSVFTVLEWDAATGADSYEVFLWKSGDPMPGTPTATVTGLSFDPVALDANIGYSWLVRSVNVFGSTTSATYTFTTGDAPPASTFDILFNVDWGKNNPDSVIQSGAGAIGSAGDVWNATDPEANVFADLANIVDSTGAPSTVNVTWSDELESIVYSGPIEFGAALNPLMEDYAFTHPDTTATVTISGLAPNADYTLYLLGVSNDAAQDSTFSVTGSNEGSQTVTSSDTVGGPVLVSPDDYVVFTGNTGASGEIVYTVTGGANFCAHNGFQLGLTSASSVKITSFTSVGGNVWELTLEGPRKSAYVFYSSPTLEFTPGTLIENLAPGTVPTGTIGGPNNEVLTTDIDGNAAVRITLAGGPRDFVRAQSAPPLLEEGFEADDGGFTVPAIGGTTEGTLWEWGQADSDNEFGLAMVNGNPPSLKCWAVGLGAFIAPGDGTNEGYYTNPTTAYLRSRPIDLTGVTAASLSFAEAIDAEVGDVVVERD